MASELHAIYQEYTRLRGSGLDSKAALAELKPRINQLDQAQREALVQQLRSWEASRSTPAARPAAPPPAAVSSAPPPTPAVPPLPAAPPTPPPAAKPAIRPIAPNAATSTREVDSIASVRCPNCGKVNKNNDIFCYSCGQLLLTTRGEFDTRQLEEDEGSIPNSELFGENTVLVLVVKGTQHSYRVRPQVQMHEIIIGRKTGGAMNPDVDLSMHDAENLGVSRMHLTLKYDGKHQTLSASDMNSANGSFINGQRLHPQEVRILRHGDELRLGKLVLQVFFNHP